MQPKILSEFIAGIERAAENNSGWEPLDDKVIIATDEVGEKSDGGVALPDDVRERLALAMEYGVIVAVGPAAFALSGDRVRVWDENHRRPQIGDRVFIERYAGQVIKGDDGKIYRIMDDKCLGAVKAKAPSEPLRVVSDVSAHGNIDQPY